MRRLSDIILGLHTNGGGGGHEPPPEVRPPRFAPPPSPRIHHELPPPDRPMVAWEPPPSVQVSPYATMEPPRGSSAAPGHVQYDIGDPTYAAQLRDAFKLIGQAGFKLASEIVPVVALSIAQAGGRPDGGGRYGQLRTAGGALTNQIIGVRPAGLEPVIVTRIIAWTEAVGHLKIHRLVETAFLPLGSAGMAEAVAMDDGQRAAPAFGLGFQRTNAQMAAVVADWDSNLNAHYVPGGKSVENARTIEGPWILDPGEALFVWGSTANIALGATIFFL